MMKNEFVKLGECRKPHGIKGAFAFHLFNKDSSILKKGFSLLLKPLASESSLANEGEEFEIKSISFGNKTICFLADVNDRNRVEEILPFEIYAKRSSFPELGEKEFYLSDLIGCDVFNESNELVGNVESLGTNGIQDILVINNQKEIFEVLLIENFVKEINLEENKIVIQMPELI